jgi:hydrogenase maturation protein HypF
MAGTTALSLLSGGSPVLATGAWFKSTVCAARNGEVRVSSTVGDLDTPEACTGFDQACTDMLGWLGERPAAIACDLHPDFYSSQVAARLAGEFGVPLVEVQHHHAHIASLCAEHGIAGPVIGLALDGVGLGNDKTAWGGELLRVDGARFERLGHFRRIALPGGDRAAREPWRVAASVLHALGRSAEITRRYADEPGAATLVTMMDRKLNCPETSSAGRVFDAAAGLLGISRRMAFEAEAAIALEKAATQHIDAHGWPVPGEWRIDADGQLDLLPVLGKLADCADTGLGSATFHATLVAALADWVTKVADRSGIGVVACGGGCFLNRLLSSGLRARLDAAGLRMFEAQRVSPGDAGIALGQAWIARRTLEN